MTDHGEQHTLSHFVHSSPGLTTHWDARPAGPSRHQTRKVENVCRTLCNSWRLIIIMTLATTLIAVIQVLVATPGYEANLTLLIEDESRSTLQNTAHKDASFTGSRSTAFTEIEILRSRMTLAQVVDNLKLYIEVQPKYFPIAAFRPATPGSRMLQTPGLFGFGGYVWGGERADVSIFNVPDAWLKREFTLIAQSGQRYRLSGAGQHSEFDGVVGERYIVHTSAGPLEIRVDRLQAKPGAIFYLTRRTRLATIEAIQRAMMIAERSKQSGIVEVKLQGKNSITVNAVLTELGREYTRHNLARTAEVTEKSLAFLSQQLLTLKRQLEESEDRYSEFRNAHGTVNLQEEARMSLQQAAAARSQRLELIQKKPC